MGLNTNTTGTYQYFDEHGLCLIKGDPDSWRDCIGRTVLCLFAYGRNPVLEAGLASCTYEYVNGQTGLFRHPDHVSDISKDHWSYYIMYKRWVLTNVDFYIFVRRLPGLPGLKLWAKALAGDKVAEWLYYWGQFFGARFGVKWNYIIRDIGFLANFYDGFGHPYGELTHVEWDKRGEKIQKGLSGWQRFWRKLLIPAYTLHNKAWQVYFMPDSPKKEALKVALQGYLPRGCTNYLLRLLLGDTSVTQSEVDSYRHMTSYRWGVFLDKTNDRTTEIITDEVLLAYNAYEVDLLKTVYEYVHNN